jgi:hypothetical protein
VKARLKGAWERKKQLAAPAVKRAQIQEQSVKGLSGEFERVGARGEMFCEKPKGANE